MDNYIVVGAGGTGSYLINNLLNYLGSNKKNKYKVTLVDGDVLEERNLLRQGFLYKDIGKNKAEALYDRFSKVVDSNIELSYKSLFINNIEDITDLVSGDKTTIISCVDNNMARYRILMAQFKLFDMYGKTVRFIDAGNDEWQGQVLANILKEGYKPPIVYKEDKIYFTGEIEGHIFSTIFDTNKNWKGSLTRGDHEFSCDVVTEVSPQNIAANMTSAMGIMNILHLTNTNTENSKRYQFNASKGTQEIMTVNGNIERIKEFVDYGNKDGKKELFRNYTDVISQEEDKKGSDNTVELDFDSEDKDEIKDYFKGVEEETEENDDNISSLIDDLVPNTDDNILNLDELGILELEDMDLEEDDGDDLSTLLLDLKRGTTHAEELEIGINQIGLNTDLINVEELNNLLNEQIIGGDGQ